MEIISNPVVAVVVLLGILVVVHEMGHFLVGRACGIAVEVFSIGFGPSLINIRRGLTQYRVGILPLGGFVKFYGSTRTEPVPPEVEGREFFSASKTSRTLTVAAGPLANFILAFIAYSYIATQGIKLPPPQIGFVLPHGAAAEVGLESGDRVVSIGDQRIETWYDLEKIISRSPGQILQFGLLRNGNSINVDITPKFEDGRIEGEKTKVGRIGISTGRLASVVTPLAKDSLAARAGLKTTDKIVGYLDGARHPQAISYWDELEPALLASASLDSITFFINRHDAKEIDENSIAVDIDLSEVNIQGDRPTILTQIGLRVADLVVEDLKDPVVAGIAKNDRILAIGGTAVENQFDYAKALRALKNDNVKFRIIRDFEEIDINLTLPGKEIDLPEGVETIYYLPVEFAAKLTAPPPIIRNYDFLGSLNWGLSETLKQSGFLVRVLGKMMSGDVALSSLGGPILIAKVAGDAAKRGFETFLTTLALISINLAVINLVPIPVLDGGQLALIGAEALRRRPLTIQTIENFQKIGFVMIMGLMVLVFYNDLSRFWSRIVKGLVAPD